MKLKTFNEILNDMANWMYSRTKRINNFQVGSIIRSLFEAIASEIQTLYFEASKSITQAIEDSTLTSFNFAKIPALPSSGSVILEFYNALSSSLLIPKGERFYTIPIYGSIVYFEVTQDVNCPSGSTVVSVPVACVQPGVIGNVPSNCIRYMSNNNYMISNVYNDKPFFNGAEEETKEERKKRFNSFIDTLSKATLNSVLYGALSVQGVSGAYVEEHVGLINLYVHDIDGNLSDSLKGDVDETLIDYRAGGVPVMVKPVIKRYIDVDMTVYLYPGYENYIDSYTSLIQDKVVSYLDSYKVARSLYLSDLLFYIKSIDEMSISYVQVNNPSTTVEALGNELIRSGVVNIQVVIADSN
jgi:hypothetical protein